MCEPQTDRALSLLEGAYDLHVHTGLDYRPRTVDDIELLREADRYGMAGVLIKNHYEPTQARAYLANRHGGTKAAAYGSITLNHTVGGLNPYAVENALRQGAKMVWMPTMDSMLCARLKLGQQFASRPGISLRGTGGAIRGEVYEIISLVKQYGACIASGHMDQQETIAFCRLALSMGAKTVVTHPDWARSTLPEALQIELADAGAFIEKVFWYLPPDKICASARNVGVDRVFFVTDRGQEGQPAPVQCLLRYIQDMLAFGLTDDEIHRLIRDVPQKIVGEA